MNTYSTIEIAKILNIHPNTIRLYEDISFITKPERKENNYRLYSDIHVVEGKIIKCLLKNELLQKGIRRMGIEVIRSCAKLDFDTSIKKIAEYKLLLIKERNQAVSAINYVERFRNNLDHKVNEIDDVTYLRSEAAEKLNITVDTLRNWELNGLITVKRKKNSYRYYNNEDMEILNLIKILRDSDYSIASILRLLSNLNKNETAYDLLNKSSNDDIITACDNLVISLDSALELEVIAEKYINDLINYVKNN